MEKKRIFIITILVSLSSIIFIPLVIAESITLDGNKSVLNGIQNG